MLKRLVPEGAVLRDVFLELHDGHVTYGRQVGTYAILVGLPYDAPLNQFVDTKVIVVLEVDNPEERRSLRDAAADRRHVGG